MYLFPAQETGNDGNPEWLFVFGWHFWLKDTTGWQHCHVWTTAPDVSCPTNYTFNIWKLIFENSLKTTQQNLGIFDNPLGENRFQGTLCPLQGKATAKPALVCPNCQCPLLLSNLTLYKIIWEKGERDHSRENDHTRDSSRTSPVCSSQENQEDL